MMATARVAAATLLAICACAAAARQTVVAHASHDAVQVPASNAVAAEARLITAAGIGGVRLGMTLDQARRALPTAAFDRSTDGDGAALVTVTLDDDSSLILYAREDDSAAPIAWSSAIATIETFSAAFHTREGIHAGASVGEAMAVWGAVREIVESEIESRQYISFERQPTVLTLRLNYSGIFAAGSRRTTQYTPDAAILGIAVSAP
jgi:hypothetical protein